MKLNSGNTYCAVCDEHKMIISVYRNVVNRSNHMCEAVIEEALYACRNCKMRLVMANKISTYEIGNYAWVDFLTWHYINPDNRPNYILFTRKEFIEAMKCGLIMRGHAFPVRMIGGQVTYSLMPLIHFHILQGTYPEDYFSHILWKDNSK